MVLDSLQYPLFIAMKLENIGFNIILEKVKLRRPTDQKLVSGI